MDDLTDRQRAAMAVIRRQARWGDPVPLGVVSDELWRMQRLSYAQTERAVKQLLHRGLIVRPTRGFYLPVPPDLPVTPAMSRKDAA